jgi:hypothetical protein
MRIRTTTGPNATPPPGRNKNSNNQHCPQQVTTVTPGATIGDRHVAAPPLRPVASITAITVVPGGGDR